MRVKVQEEGSVSPAVSVIVPVYRGKEHFRELLACLRGQTLQDMEFVFVDDWGQDGTFDLAEAAAREDSRIVCLRAACNGGPGNARNMGIEAARGKYLAFADADDLIPETFYARLYETAQKTGALVVKGCRAALYPDGTVKESQANTGIRLRKQLGGHLVNSFTYEHTTALYRRSLVEQTGARNADARQDEDTAFLLMLLCHVDWSQFAFCPSAVYYYRKHPESISSVLDNRYLEESLKSMKAKMEFLARQPDSPAVAEYAAGTVENRIYCRLADVAQGGAATKDALDQYLAGVQAVAKEYAKTHAWGKLPLMARLGLEHHGTATQLLRKMRRWKRCRLWRNKVRAWSKTLAGIANREPWTAPPTDREKNVAILNFAGGCNYGANLTAYALMKAVEQQGFHARLANRRFLYRRQDAQGQFFRFGQRYLRWTAPCYGREHFKQLNRQYQTFIVGSDQVWTYQPRWYSQPVQLRDVFDLEFTGEGSRRIAMAASLGDNATYDAAPESFCQARSAALQRFHAISVREPSAVRLCREKFNIEAQHVLDPVFLLTEDEWAALADASSAAHPARYMATCVLHAPLQPFVEQVSRQCQAAGLPPVGLMGGEVTDWVRLVQRADVVLTDSFHVACFSLIFHKPFIFLDNGVRGGDRVPGLMAALGVETEIVAAQDALQGKEETVIQVAERCRACAGKAMPEGRLAEERQRTAQFLAQALSLPTGGQETSPMPDPARLKAERKQQRRPYARGLVRSLCRWGACCVLGCLAPRFRPKRQRAWQAVQSMWDGLQA